MVRLYQNRLLHWHNFFCSFLPTNSNAIYRPQRAMRHFPPYAVHTIHRTIAYTYGLHPATSSNRMECSPTKTLSTHLCCEEIHRWTPISANAHVMNNVFGKYGSFGVQCSSTEQYAPPYFLELCLADQVNFI